MIFGTLLGAIRHGGFIPWDLDFDLAIPEESYADGITCVRKELPGWLVLQDSKLEKNYCAFWAKVVDTKTKTWNTKYINDNRYTYTGLHLDLYMLKRTNSENYRYDVLNDNLLYFKKRLDRQLISQSEYLDTIAPLTKEISKIKPTKAKRDKYYFLSLIQTDAANIFPTQKIQFERLTLQAPQDCRKVLEDSYYGKDYMTPPAFDDRDIRMNRIVFL